MTPTTIRIYIALASIILAGYVIYAEITYRGSSELRPVLIALGVAIVLVGVNQIYNRENATSEDAKATERQAAAEAGYPQIGRR